MEIRSSLIGCMQSGFVITRRTHTGDGFGGEIETYVTVNSQWRARLWEESREMERGEPGITYFTTHRIQGTFTDLLVDDRIEDGDDTYEVRRVESPPSFRKRTNTVLADLVKINQATG
jgi:head-tail adaptor